METQATEMTEATDVTEMTEPAVAPAKTDRKGDGGADGAQTELAPASESLRQQILQIRDKIDAYSWEMSEALYKVYQEGLYVDWGYGSFREYVEVELDFALRKAQYLVSIQEWFHKMPQAVKDWVREIGWTKAKELVGVVSAENFEEWRERLEGKSYREIVEILKSGADEEPQGDDDGDEGSKKKDEKLLKKVFALYPAQAENVQAALELAKEMAKSDKDGHALDLICTEFLSTNAGAPSVEDYLKKVERIVGVRIVALDVENDLVVYGGDVLDELSDDQG